jgi:hypothetical protein
MHCAIHLLWGSLGEWRTAGLEQGTILGLAHRLDLATDRNKHTPKLASASERSIIPNGTGSFAILTRIGVALAVIRSSAAVAGYGTEGRAVINATFFIVDSIA